MYSKSDLEYFKKMIEERMREDAEPNLHPDHDPKYIEELKREHQINKAKFEEEEMSMSIEHVELFNILLRLEDEVLYQTNERMVRGIEEMFDYGDGFWLGFMDHAHGGILSQKIREYDRKPVPDINEDPSMPVKIPRCNKTINGKDRYARMYIDEQYRSYHRYMSQHNSYISSELLKNENNKNGMFEKPKEENTQITHIGQDYDECAQYIFKENYSYPQRNKNMEINHSDAYNITGISFSEIYNETGFENKNHVKEEDNKVHVEKLIFKCNEHNSYEVLRKNKISKPCKKQVKEIEKAIKIEKSAVTVTNNDEYSINNKGVFYKCKKPKCGKVYRSPWGLKYHSKNKHIRKDNSSRVFKCRVARCKARFKNRNGLQYHMDHFHID